MSAEEGSDLWGRGPKSTAKKVTEILPLPHIAHKNKIECGVKEGGGNMLWLRIGGPSGDVPVDPQLREEPSAAVLAAIGRSVQIDSDHDEEDGSGALDTQSSAPRRLSQGPELSSDELRKVGELLRRLTVEHPGEVKTFTLPPGTFRSGFPTKFVMLPHPRGGESARTARRRAAVLRFASQELSRGIAGGESVLVTSAHRSVIAQNVKLARSLMRDLQLPVDASVRLYIALGSFRAYRWAQSFFNYEMRQSGSLIKTLLLPTNRLRAEIGSQVWPARHHKPTLELAPTKDDKKSVRRRCVPVWCVDDLLSMIASHAELLSASGRWVDRRLGFPRPCLCATVLLDGGGTSYKLSVAVGNSETPQAPRDLLWVASMPKRVRETADNWRSVIEGPLQDELDMVVQDKVALLRVKRWLTDTPALGDEPEWGATFLGLGGALSSEGR